VPSAVYAPSAAYVPSAVSAYAPTALAATAYAPNAYAPAHPPRTVLVCEDITNIDNIGQLFRIAAAFAADLVLLSPSCHDPLYRKSLRVSCGCALQVPFARSDDWQGDLARIRDDAGFLLVGATGGGAQRLQDVAAQVGGLRPRRLAVVVGAEFAGLRADTLAVCSFRAKIPMAHGVDSLNVGVAAGVFLARLAET
jgi:tRNA G18 (ribose-2'-O)-methylase SpoU